MEAPKVMRICGTQPNPQIHALASLTKKQEEALIKLLGRQRLDTTIAIGMGSDELLALSDLYKRLIVRKRICAHSTAN